MLLKDLEIEVKNHGVFLGVNIIIKRDEKHYSVYNNYFCETEKKKGEHKEPSWQFINEAIKHYMLHCENINKKWLTSDMPSITSEWSIFEHEIEL